MLLTIFDQQFKELQIAERLVDDLHFKVAVVDMPKINTIIIATYRSPNAIDDTFFVKMEKLLNKIKTMYPNSHIYLCGDFNIDLNDDTVTSRYLVNVMAEYGLAPCFVEPSRIQNSSATCIDNVFANQQQYQAETFDPHLSDHRAQCLTVEILQSGAKSPSEKRVIRLVNVNNLNILTADLAQVDWTVVLSANAPEWAFDRFFEVLNDRFK